MGEIEKGFKLVFEEYIANQKNPFYVGVYEAINDEYKKTTA
jgi:hypothetical protein